MNRMKKFASIMLALVMAFALMAPAFASGTTEVLKDGTGSITINNATVGHTYDAYQIFKGDLSYTSTETNGDAKNPVLSNIEWGNGVISDEAALAAANSVSGLENAQNAAEVAALLADPEKGISAEDFAQRISEALSTTKYSSNKVAEGVDTANISSVPVGYYLIKDNPNDPAVEGDAVSLFMLQVVGPTVVESKVGAPESDKKITGGTSDKYTNENIGDTVTFTLTAKIGDNYDKYDSYKLIFHDTMSKGLTLDKSTITVKKGEEEFKLVTTGDDGYTVDVKDYVGTGENDPYAGGKTITISFSDLKKATPSVQTGDVITVTYKATLNSDAVIGNPGNPNTMHLEYSNNPNDNQDGTGETPEKEVVVFTFELDSTKVDGASKNEDGTYETKLAGAEFVLKNASGEGEGEGVQYAVINAETGKFVRWSDTKIDTTNEQGETTKLVSGSDGTFKVSGIDAGTYYLEETKAPVGYNLPSPAETKVEIKATITEAGQKPADGETAVDKTQVTKLEVVVGEGDKAQTSEGNASTGIVNTTIENNKGATLPETGGIGTTIFYALGGVMAVGAVVLLVTKKRMNADK